MFYSSGSTGTSLTAGLCAGAFGVGVTTGPATRVGRRSRRRGDLGVGDARSGGAGAGVGSLAASDCGGAASAGLVGLAGCATDAGFATFGTMTG